MSCSIPLIGTRRTLIFLEENGFAYDTPLSASEQTLLLASILNYVGVDHKVYANIRTLRSKDNLGSLINDIFNAGLGQFGVKDYLEEVKRGTQSIPGVLELVNVFGYDSLKEEILEEELKPFLRKVKKLYEESPNKQRIVNKINFSDQELMGNLGLYLHVVERDVDAMITDAYRMTGKLGRFHQPSLNFEQSRYLNQLIRDRNIGYREAAKMFTEVTGMNVTHHHLIQLAEKAGLPSRKKNKRC